MFNNNKIITVLLLLIITLFEIRTLWIQSQKKEEPSVSETLVNITEEAKELQREINLINDMAKRFSSGP